MAEKQRILSIPADERVVNHSIWYGNGQQKMALSSMATAKTIDSHSWHKPSSTILYQSGMPGSDQLRPMLGGQALSLPFGATLLF